MDNVVGLVFEKVVDREIEGNVVGLWKVLVCVIYRILVVDMFFFW